MPNPKDAGARKFVFFGDKGSARISDATEAVARVDWSVADMAFVWRVWLGLSEFCETSELSDFGESTLAFW